MAQPPRISRKKNVPPSKAGEGEKSKSSLKRTSPVKSGAPSAAGARPRPTRRKYQFDVCLSFAGEDRARVEKINNRLKAKGIKTFYDFDYQADLWGKNLYDHLGDVYTNKARFCVIFVSKHYVRKTWTNHERQSAQARAFLSDSEYILYVSMDDTPLPGLLPTMGILRIKEHGVIGITKMIEQKVLANRPRKTAPVKTPTTSKTTIRKRPRAKVLGAPQSFACSSRISASGDWILLDGWFYKGKVKSQGGKLHLEVVANEEQEARLNALNPHAQRFHSHRRLSFAHRNTGHWCHIEDVASSSTGRKITFNITLSPELGHQSNYGNVWSHQDASVRAASILLSSTEEHHSQRLLSYSSTKKLFPEMWTRLQGQKMLEADVLRCARLEAVFHLLSNGLTERVVELALGPASKGVFKIKFRGLFLSPYSGQKPQPVEVEGKASFHE